MNVDDTGVKNIAFVFVVEGLHIHNPIKEDLKKTRSSKVQDVFSMLKMSLRTLAYPSLPAPTLHMSAVT
nr:hypothetical protein [Tanacetum cinerariifolium]